jgi:hypothetical protein
MRSLKKTVGESGAGEPQEFLMSARVAAINALDGVCSSLTCIEVIRMHIRHQRNRQPAPADILVESQRLVFETDRF